MKKTYVAERNLKGERYVFYILEDEDDIYVEGPQNSLGYHNRIFIYPPDVFGTENYGCLRHVAPWKLKELRKTYNRLIERMKKDEINP